MCSVPVVSNKHFLSYTYFTGILFACFCVSGRMISRFELCCLSGLAGGLECLQLQGLGHVEADPHQWTVSSAGCP